MKLFRVIQLSNARRANRTKSKTLILITAIAALAVVPAPVVLSVQQKFTIIDVAGATGTAAEGINPQGDIAGFYNDSSGNSHGFLLSNGSFITIDAPGAVGPKGMRLTREATSWGILMTAAAATMVFC